MYTGGAEESGAAKDGGTGSAVSGSMVCPYVSSGTGTGSGPGTGAGAGAGAGASAEGTSNGAGGSNAGGGVNGAGGWNCCGSAGDGLDIGSGEEEAEEVGSEKVFESV
ncbi:hypothetical protein GCM10027598_15360 [Amycolatopsis oliviviridis]|uniref:Uncharacterized protein n=1 Tax=Amycolatopsis oliviviridis TaxID=1471590 RepID=A0ABQ3LTE8_9PSEU|nr:hypothetical protein GCM10017790_50780 [Amycolatopsis oliviviridis]